MEHSTVLPSTTIQKSLVVCLTGWELILFFFSFFLPLSELIS